MADFVDELIIVVVGGLHSLSALLAIYMFVHSQGSLLNETNVFLFKVFPGLEYAL